MQDSNHEAKDKMLDDLLDGALAEYSNVEPRAGLENRILARLSEPGGLAFWNWKWVVGLAATCVVLAVIFVFQRESRPVVAVKESPEVKSVGIPPTTMAKLNNPGTGVHRNLPSSLKSAQPRAAVPQASKPVTFAVLKQQTFPAPAPLSEQE